MKLEIAHESFPIAGSFVISGRGDDKPWVRTEAWVLTVTIERDGIVGRGECTPYPRYNETLESSEAEIRVVEAELASGLDRQGLLDKFQSRCSVQGNQ